MIFGDVITDPTFPPLLSGEKVSRDVDPFIKAVGASMMGCDPGTVFYAEDTNTLCAAITFAPEVPLKESVSVIHAVMLSLADSLGALGPPELAVHFVWPSQLKINAARCGELQFKASTTQPDLFLPWRLQAALREVGGDLVEHVGGLCSSTEKAHAVGKNIYCSPKTIYFCRYYDHRQEGA